MTLTRNIELFATDDDHAGHLRVYARVGDSVIPIAETKLGHLEQFSRVPAALAVKQDDEKQSEPPSPPAS